MRLPAPLLGGGARLSSLSLSAAATDDAAATNSVLATALPMLGACIAEPTLSWIDSICVARFAASPSVGLAALSVDSAIFNMLACCTSFLCTATTNIVGSQADDDEHVGRALFDGVMISLLVGGLAAAAMTFGRRVLVGGFLGAGAESGIFAPACAYLRIRALAAPAATATLVGAGVCFGLGDQITPVRAIAAAAAVNVVGDLLLIGPCGLGLSGAAAATALANYAAAAMVVGPLWRRYRPRWRRPRYADLRRFAAVSGALLAGTSFASLTYAATPRVVSGDVTRAAAHQIALSLWWLISFVSVPLSLAGQSLLPRRLSADPALARRTALAIARLGAYCAALCAGLNALIPTVWAGAFSKSPEVLAALGSVTATAAAAQAALSFATALDGVFLGCGWRGHYVRTVALSTCAAGAVFVAASRCGGSLVGVWLGLFLFGAVRAACHAAALPLLLRKLAGDAKVE